MTEINGYARPRVVVADEHEMARIISRIVGLQFEVIKVVHDGQSAIDAVLNLQPDVLVMDVLLPLLDGIQVVRRLKALKTISRVVMLTGLENKEHMDAAMTAGASAFVFKTKMASDLLRAIGEVLAGRTFVSTHKLGKPGDKS
jgi:two-component system response regulator DegU